MQIKARIAFTKCPIDKWDREKEITKDQLSILRRLFEQLSNNRLTQDQNVNLTNIYNDIFGMRKSVTTCSSCVKQIIDDLKKVYEAYEKRTK